MLAQDSERKDTKMQDANVGYQRLAGFTFLPPVESLVAKLNELGDAERSGNVQKAQEIEREIMQMPKMGLYEGYPDDDLAPAFCSFFAVERVNHTADIHIFRVCFFKLGDRDPDNIYYMDLIDFLSPAWRTTNVLERAHYGSKFWQ